MLYKPGLAGACLLCIAASAWAQKDTLAAKSLEEVTLSANRWEQKLNEVPNKITKISRPQILFNNPQTAADLLAQTGTVFVQKSQLGGGSPIIRGFATNRVLLVVDGVRMNNAIYRSGNLQNVIQIDALSTETAEVIFGPGSLTYGSDAIGGVMDFHTLQPRLATNDTTLVRGTALVRYSSANNEHTGHADVHVAAKKWALLSSVTYSQFDDLKMGRNGGQDSYLRREYVQRINGVDSIVQNSNPRVQRFSGYDQWNFLGKLRFKPTERLHLQYSFTYAGTGNAPRYDRLIQYRQGLLRFAEWEYGPMLWRMHQARATLSADEGLYDELRLTAAYQDYEESRIERQRGRALRNIQTEQVDALSINLDATKSVGIGELFYGVEYVTNKVGSAGYQTDITTGAINPFGSRYPDGSTWKTGGIYSSCKINLTPKTTATGGLRYSHNKLSATFDTSFIKLPYQTARLRDGGLTGSLGVAHRAGESWQLNAAVSTGYRMPNVDDIGKLFESVPGNLTVPNPTLGAEYAWNFEGGVVQKKPGKYHIELNGFYTLLTNAIVRRPFTFNGQDSISFDGTRSRVEALQNVARATVWGVQASAEVFFTPALSLQSHANWIEGRETDDVNDEQVPLRHAAPFYGSTRLIYQAEKWTAEASLFYNSKIKHEDLAPSEQAKTDIYATDAAGNPYAPGWYTLNLRTSYRLTKNLMATAGWENITNQRYRPYSSGIVAAGSNFIFSLRASL